MIKEDGITYLEEEDAEPAISTLGIGKSCWTVPWALGANSCGAVYLRLSFNACEKPGGTVDTRITRTGEDSWKVVLPADYTFRREHDPNPYWEVSYDLDIRRTA